MTKKTLIPALMMLASSIVAPLINMPSAQAEKLIIDDTEYWTMDEVMAESEEYEKNRTICDGNRECEDYLETAYILAGGKYSAAASFSDYYFMITAINPSKSTISVRFNDTAATRWFHNDEAAQKDILKNLYLFWWEDGVPEYGLRVFINPSPSRHEIFTYLANPGEEWLPANQEYEIVLKDFDFNILKTTSIYFAVQSELSDALSGRHFEDCLTSIDGEVNYECRAAFDYMGNIIYQPYEIKTPEEPKNESTSETQLEPEATNEPEITTDTSTENLQNEPTPEAISTSTIGVPATTSNTSKTLISRTDRISTSTIRVPESTINTVAENTTGDTTKTPTESSKTTGTSQDISDSMEVPLAAGNTEKEHTFPWWIILFTFSGIFLMLWWLIPVKKFEKKSRKTLDK